LFGAVGFDAAVCLLIARAPGGLQEEEIDTNPRFINSLALTDCRRCVIMLERFSWPEPLSKEVPYAGGRKYVRASLY